MTDMLWRCSPGSVCRHEVNAVQLNPRLDVEFQLGSVLPPPSLRTYCIVFHPMSYLAHGKCTGKNCRTSLKHCLFSGFCVNEDVHVQMHCEQDARHLCRCWPSSISQRRTAVLSAHKGTWNFAYLQGRLWNFNYQWGPRCPLLQPRMVRHLVCYLNWAYVNESSKITRWIE